MSIEDAIRSAVAQEVAPLKEEIDQLKSKVDPDELVMLKRRDLAEIFGVTQPTITNLLNRQDFPVFREVGVRVPKHLLKKWIEDHTEWIKENVPDLKKIHAI
ncbi:helix-turn-helix domain-containing protein [Sporolactobacillus sp. CQH2019]|uniref:helix-turn-helix domain-containing protein n=1 Tax=Sporolactobacillus sp. CQH2019 TaxID=3023512 RepID=UPI002367F217|nr:helix-turn-helix domain-containing protein [Sporolactobacillus sp. CQH2019]MDD9147856.1 helix-turn-helix domain-containing protein [Sporolactobacillus sp. CQH2019]